jgi:hypothetical protein
MLTIKIILKKDKLNEQGLAPLYLRLTKDRKSKFISLQKYLRPEEWNEKLCKVRKAHKNSVQLNAFLAQKVA